MVRGSPPLPTPLLWREVPPSHSLSALPVLRLNPRVDLSDCFPPQLCLLNSTPSQTPPLFFHENFQPAHPYSYGLSELNYIWSYSKIASYLCVLSFQLLMSRRADARKRTGFRIRYLFSLPCVDELLNFSVWGVNKSM